jgi:hypothetical protein
MENTYLDLLCDLFGNHYGSSFNILGTPIFKKSIPAIQKLIDIGELSPLEIHDLLNDKFVFYNTEIQKEKKLITECIEAGNFNDAKNRIDIIQEYKKNIKRLKNNLLNN